MVAESPIGQGLEKELAAVYTVNITGIKRARNEMAGLDAAIKSLRSARYGSSSVTALAASGSGDVAVALVDELEGRVQTAVEHALLESMKFGRDLQAAALQAATTNKGRSGRPAGRNGPGRDVTGAMIDALAFNVEVYKSADTTRYTGWHGWADAARDTYIEYQEEGTKYRGGANKHLSKLVGTQYRAPQGKKPASLSGVPAANSLGVSIVPTREALKALIGALR